jgi:geranylgeranyl diphosphate synthase type I
VIGHPGAAVSRDARLVLNPSSPLTQPFRDVVSAEVTAFLEAQKPVLDAIGSELGSVHRMAGQLLRGGKRLRPAFCVWGYVAAAGLPTVDLRPLLAGAASLELLHASALVHDDVMDASDVRRGKPAAHRQFEALHAGSAWRGSSAGFGQAAAILLGDLLIMWSVQLLSEAGLAPSALARALPVVEAMRTEVTCGQYLDVVAQTHPLRLPADASAHQFALAEAARVVEYKSARYTVQRPAQMGAALGGGGAALDSVLAAYGSPLGRAFQFRDDLLGVFGDAAITGKPAGDDLREGKRTVLVAHALTRASQAGRRLLSARLGDPALDAAGVADLQQVISEAGSREAVEAMITAGHAEAVAALDQAEMTVEGKTALTALADAAVRRDS